MVSPKLCVMPTAIPDEVTTKEALDILGLAHPSSVTRMVAEGKLQPSRKLALGYLFLRSDIEAVRDERAAVEAERAAARAEAS